MSKTYTQELVKKISTDFFRYWWNTPGANTDEGFDKWWSFHQYDYTDQPIADKAPIEEDEIDLSSPDYSHICGKCGTRFWTKTKDDTICESCKSSITLESQKQEEVTFDEYDSIDKVISFLEGMIIECKPDESCGRCDDTRKIVAFLKFLQHQQPATPVSAEEILYNTMYENNFTYDSFPAFIENESSVDVYDICCKAMESLKQFRPISVTEEERLELHFLEEEFFLEHWITEMDLKGLTAMSNKMTQRLQWVKGQVKPMTPGKENNQ